jgi:amino acid permease
MVRVKFTVNSAAKSETSEDHVNSFCDFKAFAARLTTRKTITQLQNEANSGNELKRTLGSFQLLALGIGGIIGK